MIFTDHTVLFGGSFDPPHVGHQAICQWLIEALDAKRVIVVPTYEHCFGKKLTSFRHRVSMCRAMVQNMRNCDVSIAEEFTPRPNYTINLIHHHLEINPNDKLAVVVGGDLLAQLHEWERWDEVPKLAKIIAIGRPGYNTRPSLSNIDVYPVGISTVSSSEVREKLVNDEPLDGFVPLQVKEYILSHELYKQ